MKPVTTTMRVAKAAYVLGGLGLATGILSSLLDKDMMLVGFALGAALLVAAVPAYLLAPKRTVVLLDVRGDELFVTSRLNPVQVKVGRLYQESMTVPIRSIRTLVSRELNLSNEFGHFVDVCLTRLDGTIEDLLLPAERRDEVQGFLRQLQENWPHIEVVDEGYHTRVSWRRWKSLARPW